MRKIFQRALVLCIVLLLALTGAAIAEGTNDPADGKYLPYDFSWSGGTGRLKSIDCTDVLIRDGQAYATIVIGSKNYLYIRVGDEICECESDHSSSTAVIPVEINTPMKIYACTSAMSEPHEIEYTITIYLGTSEQDEENRIMIAGVPFEADRSAGTEDIQVYRSENIDLIKIDGTDLYCICAGDSAVPEGMADKATVVIQPIRNAYIAVPFAAEYLAAHQAGGIRFLSDECGEASGDMINVGTQDQTDYRSLLLGGCDLAVVSSEDEAVYLRELGIPVLVDRFGEDPGESESRAMLYRLFFNFTDE